MKNSRESVDFERGRRIRAQLDEEAKKTRLEQEREHQKMLADWIARLCKMVQCDDQLIQKYQAEIDGVKRCTEAVRLFTRISFYANVHKIVLSFEDL